MKTNNSILYKYQNNIIKQTSNGSEIAILNQLNHPQIINILDSYIYNNQYHQVMYLYPNGDLYENILQNKIDINKKFIKNIIKPIQYIHHNNLVHLDIKLENFLLDNNNNSILIDFQGSRKHVDEYYKLIQVEDYHKCIYTRYYTSPEYLNGYYSKSSDMYSLGVLLYTAFTRNTLDIENINRCNKVTKLPYNIELLIKKLLENNPYDRPSIYDIKSYID